MARKLIVPIDEELEKEMKAHPEVDWVKVAIKAIRDCIRDRESCKFYDTIVERAISQERKRESETSSKKSKEVQ